ncbi:uncharacterized protein LOC125720920 [Brienomyrus brachyistius]|uniref:uncharacterized protein LOC125720920 n=1 Tax=Brienomyrus brachyistius TaxID=42636 RepID=UPI0020B1F1DB|nr:uncharacterized protein LOC125720920 [Brienomyrus brachyistius]
MAGTIIDCAQKEISQHIIYGRKINMKEVKTFSSNEEMHWTRETYCSNLHQLMQHLTARRLGFDAPYSAEAAFQPSVLSDAKQPPATVSTKRRKRKKKPANVQTLTLGACTLVPAFLPAGELEDSPAFLNVTPIAAKLPTQAAFPARGEHPAAADLPPPLKRSRFPRPIHRLLLGAPGEASLWGGGSVMPGASAPRVCHAP